jgi:O-antigen ligase
VWERFSADDNGSSAARAPLNALALAIIKDHPVAGIGANNFALAMQPYLPRHFQGEFVYIVHNTYLLVWAEMGTGGLVAFVCFLAAVLSQGFRRHPRRGRVALPRLGCAAAVVCAMVQMTVEPGRGGAAGPALWLFAGIVVALSRGESIPGFSHDPERFRVAGESGARVPGVTV